MRVPRIQGVKKYFEERRHRRFLWIFDFPENGCVLDVSCGDGDFLSVIHSHFPKLELHGIDLSENCIERAKTKCPNGTFIVARAEALPYTDKKFNAVLSCMSLHHYENPKEIFSEISRMLLPGGKFYLIDLIPTYRWSQLLNNWDGCPEPYHFERYYLKEEVATLAKSAGMIVSSDKRMSRFSGHRLLAIHKA